jgi:hypothetical protein
MGGDEGGPDAILSRAVTSVTAIRTGAWLERFKLPDPLGVGSRYRNRGPEWRGLGLRPPTLCPEADPPLVGRVAWWLEDESFSMVESSLVGFGRHCMLPTRGRSQQLDHGDRD